MISSLVVSSTVIETSVWLIFLMFKSFFRKLLSVSSASLTISETVSKYLSCLTFNPLFSAIFAIEIAWLLILIAIAFNLCGP